MRTYAAQSDAQQTRETVHQCYRCTDVRPGYHKVESPTRPSGGHAACAANFYMKCYPGTCSETSTCSTLISQPSPPPHLHYTQYPPYPTTLTLSAATTNLLRTPLLPCPLTLVVHTSPTHPDLRHTQATTLLPHTGSVVLINLTHHQPHISS